MGTVVTGFGGFSSAEAEQMLQDATRRLKNVGELRERTEGLVGKAESEDGRVTVEYKATGDIAALKIDPRAMRMQSEELAAAILATISAAAADLRDKMNEVVKDLLPERERTFDLEATRRQLDDSVTRFARTAGRAEAQAAEQIQRKPTDR
jgi:DNA-binding protein YbaB